MNRTGVRTALTIMSTVIAAAASAVLIFPSGAPTFAGGSRNRRLVHRLSGPADRLSTRLISPTEQ